MSFLGFLQHAIKRDLRLAIREERDLITQKNKVVTDTGWAEVISLQDNKIKVRFEDGSEREVLPGRDLVKLRSKVLIVSGVIVTVG